MREVESVVAQMNPSMPSCQPINAERVDVIMRQFLQRVKHSLHLIVCLRFNSNISVFVFSIITAFDHYLLCFDALFNCFYHSFECILLNNDMILSTLCCDFSGR